MSADISVLLSLGVFCGFLGVLMVYAIPGLLLEPAKEVLWGLRALFGPAK